MKLFLHGYYLKDLLALTRLFTSYILLFGSAPMTVAKSHPHSPLNRSIAITLNVINSEINAFEVECKDNRFPSLMFTPEYATKLAAKEIIKKPALVALPKCVKARTKQEMGLWFFRHGLKKYRKIFNRILSHHMKRREHPWLSRSSERLLNESKSLIEVLKSLGIPNYRLSSPKNMPMKLPRDNSQRYMLTCQLMKEFAAFLNDGKALILEKIPRCQTKRVTRHPKKVFRVKKIRILQTQAKIS